MPKFYTMAEVRFRRFLKEREQAGLTLPPTPEEAAEWSFHLGVRVGRHMRRLEEELGIPFNRKREPRDD